MNAIMGLVVAVVGAFAAVWVHDRWHRRIAQRRLAGRPELTPDEFGLEYFGARNSRAKVAAQVREILSHHVPYELEGLHPRDRFIEDMRMDELDSMSTVEVVVELEKHFGIEIPDSDAESLRTVGELVDYLDRRLNECGAAHVAAQQ
jgi:acyl carrier protein